MKGSLTVKNGKYHVVISYKDENGIHKKKWVATGLDEKNNKRAADETMRNIVASFKDQQLIQGSEIISDKIESPLYADYLYDWLEMAKANLQVSTYASYLDNVKQISTYFREKGIRLIDLKPADINGYYQHIIKNGGKIQKCEHHHIVIHRSLNVAYRSELIPVNPSDKVERPRSPKYQAKHYDYKKMLQLFEALPGDRFELIYFIVALTGLRRSEICGIKWDAIDFDKNMVHINHAVLQTKVNGKNTVVCKNIMKNKTSRRTLPLIPILKQKLLKEKENQDRRRTYYNNYYNKSYLEYVCVDEVGSLVKPNTVSNHFDILLKQNGLPQIRFHDLRHSFASLLLACGASLKEVSEWLGHSTITITSDLYGHLDFNSKLTVANTVAKLFGYETVESADQSPYEIIRGLFSDAESNQWETTDNMNSHKKSDLPNEIAVEQYRLTKQEMSRLGFTDMDEYFDYLKYMETKKSRSKKSEIEM